MGKELFNWVLSEFNCTLEIVKRQKRKKGFQTENGDTNRKRGQTTFFSMSAIL
jgi:hypothetical protein